MRLPNDSGPNEGFRLRHIVSAVFAVVLTACLLLPALAGEDASSIEKPRIKLTLLRTYQTDDAAIELGYPRLSDKDDQGRLFGLDLQLRKVHVWNPDGTYQTSFAQGGEGPGELALKAQMGDIVVFKDKIIVVDEQVSKLHIFDHETFAYQKTLPRPPQLSRLYLFENNKHLYAMNLSNARKVQELVRLDDDLNFEKVIYTTAFDKYDWIDKERYIYRPYANSLLLGVHQGLIFLGQTRTNELRVFNAAGQEIKMIHVPMLASPVRREDREHYIAIAARSAGRIKLEFSDESVVYNKLLLFNELFLVLKTYGENNRIEGMVFSHQYQPLGRLNTTVEAAADLDDQSRLGEIQHMFTTSGEMLVLSLGEDGLYRINAFKANLRDP